MIKQAVIFMDVDGTLTVDASNEVHPERRKMVRDLVEAGHEIVIFSNKKNHERNAAVARSLNLPYLETPLKKPDPRILDLVDHGVKPVEVYGDKWWTDGRFAKKIGAHFVKVDRLRGSGESLGIKLSYLLDDLFAKLLA